MLPPAKRKAAILTGLAACALLAGGCYSPQHKGMRVQQQCEVLLSSWMSEAQPLANRRMIIGPDCEVTFEPEEGPE